MNALRSHSFVVMLVAFTMSACASLNTPIDGVVIDTSTGKPIAGAFVIVSWHARGSDGYGSRSSCPHMDIVRSDTEGRYRLPAQPYAESDNAWSTVYAYVPGYEFDESVKHERGFLTDMKPFTGTGDERVKRFNTYGSLEACGPEDRKYSLLAPLFNAIDEEADRLVLSDQKIHRSRSYSRSVERGLELYLREKNEKQDTKK